MAAFGNCPNNIKNKPGLPFIALQVCPALSRLRREHPEQTMRHVLTKKLTLTLKAESNSARKSVMFLIAFSFLLLLQTTLLFAEDMIDRTPPQSSGMINRAPVEETNPTDLDKISTDIDDIMRSINELVAEEAKPVADVKPVKSEKMSTDIDDVLHSIDGLVAEETKKNAPVIAKPQSTTPEPVKTVKTSPEKPAEPIAEKPQIVAPAAVKVVTKPPVEKTAPVLTVKTPVMEKTELAYLKHDKDGNLLPDNQDNWVCVEDTRNNLTWEVKSSNGDLRDKNNSYSWFTPSHEGLKGIADGGRCKGDISCDTNAYIQAINKQNLCGHNDWRLPTREEMQSLVYHKNSPSDAKINSEYFPQAMPSWYWTASSNKDKPEYAWYILFRNGVSLNDLKKRPKHLRLVRSNKKV
jgi:hypothetical protein